MDPGDLLDVLGAAAPARRADVLARLVAHCWPAATEATVPAARPWLRRWGPASMPALAPRCACDTGRCPWCN